MLADALTLLPPLPRSAYHWTLPRQRAFLEHFAISGSVTHAAHHVGVSPRAAYDLRHRRDGLLFGVGWGAAVLLARYRLTDLLLERAIDGVEEVAVRFPAREDGSAEYRRRKYDGRLGLGMLARLDRMALPAADADPEEVALHRAVAQDFESFLDRLSPPPEPPQPAGDAASTVAQPPAVEDTTTEVEAPSPADDWEQALWPDPDAPDWVEPGPLPPTPADAEMTNPEPLTPAEAPIDADDRTAETIKAELMLDADGLEDAKARIAVHLAAQARGGSPLGRLARETGLHCEVAQKSVPSAAGAAEEEAPWSPPKPTEQRERELQTQIHDLIDKIEDQRAAAGLNAIDIRWDSCVLAQAFHELAKMDEEKLMPFGAFLRAELAPYGAAWRELDPAHEIDPDSDLARLTAPNNMFDSVELRREDSIKSRIDRLMAVGKARAVPVEAEERAEAED